jgi:hypothetical protein
MQLRKNILVILIIIDVIWSISALIYDFERIINLPIFFWPFIAICPIFPMLLAIHWMTSIYGKQNNFLLSFASIPSFVYLIAAIIYYPTWITLNGFDILSFGQIFWVAVYGLQGLFLIIHNRIKPVYSALVSIFLLISFFVQFSTKSFSFFDTSNFSRQLIVAEYLTVAIFTLVLFLVLAKRSKKL